MPTLAIGVNEMECNGNGFVRRAFSSLGGNRFLAKRLAGRREPLLPFSGTLRLTVGEQ